ncbi:aminoglycoside 6'-N-acetyltransferase I [Elusimicrobium simillimum]|uniref:GNAT family N-acetyltransferase n=1 Tax=Elusimicrobium simillimum TaxID=3143438 RepID=UPI003C6F582A
MIKKWTGNIEELWPLLLSADPEKAAVNKYLPRSDVFVLEHYNKPIGVMCVTKESDGFEIKNLAVLDTYRGRGYGKKLVWHAACYARELGAVKLSVGTAITSGGNLTFYEKQGFKPGRIIKDFFVKNYKKPIIENGELCKDMQLFEKLL